MMRLFLVGGGTLGPVAPLVAIGEAAKERGDLEIVGFIGTARGPERALVASLGVPFFPVWAGKWRRYWDIRNLLAPFVTLIGIVQAYRIIAKLKPDVIVSGGSFVGVPVVIVARLLGIKTVIHQQDVVPSLANKFVAALANTITVTFPETAAAFPKEKTVVIGNPVRPSVLRGNRERALHRFDLDPEFPTLFVFGGGTGAQFLNDLVEQALPKLTEVCQVVHATGVGKFPLRLLQKKRRYHPIEIFREAMPDVYAVADVVLARAGIGTITELAALGKPAIIVPIPHSHQEQNAALLAALGAAEVCSQSELTPDALVELVCALLADRKKLRDLGESLRKINPPNALAAVLQVIQDVAK